MYKKKLKKQRHTVSMLTEHLVFSPKYRGKVLVGEVGKRCEDSIQEICEEMGIEIIEIAVNVDHVHLFIEFPPKYSLSYIANRIKGKSSRQLRREFPHLVEWCPKGLWAPSCFHGNFWKKFHQNMCLRHLQTFGLLISLDLRSRRGAWS